MNSRRNAGRPCFKILGYIIGSLKVNVPAETFSCHIRDIGSQSETTTFYRLFGRRDWSSIKPVVEAMFEVVLF